MQQTQGAFLYHLTNFAFIVTPPACCVMMLVGFFCCFIHFRRSCREFAGGIKTLRIGRMLIHTGISRARYLYKARPPTIERRLPVWECCINPDEYGACLKQGKDIPVYPFCRNYRELSQYR